MNDRHDLNDQELTPSERRAFDSLPRERQPSDLLEERTVRALRRGGIIRARSRRGIVLSSGWIAAATAAMLVLILGSFATGQWLGSRQTSRAMLAMHQQDSAQAAASVASVQQASATYLAALSDLIRTTSSADEAERARTRDTALHSLYQAANQMVRLAPDDPVVSRILQGFDQSASRQQNSSQPEDQRIIWF